MRESTDRQRREARRLAKATARGAAIRRRIHARLRKDGPATVAELVEALSPDIAEMEIAFQLDRLEDEGRAAGDEGKFRAL